MGWGGLKALKMHNYCLGLFHWFLYCTIMQIKLGVEAVHLKEKMPLLFCPFLLVIVKEEYIVGCSPYPKVVLLHILYLHT